MKKKKIIITAIALLLCLIFIPKINANDSSCELTESGVTYECHPITTELCFEWSVGNIYVACDGVKQKKIVDPMIEPDE